VPRRKGVQKVLLSETTGKGKESKKRKTSGGWGKKKTSHLRKKIQFILQASQTTNKEGRKGLFIAGERGPWKRVVSKTGGGGKNSDGKGTQKRRRSRFGGKST